MSNKLTHYDPNALSETAVELLKRSTAVTETQKQYESHFRIFNRWREQKGVVTSTPTHLDIINFMADQFTGHMVKRDKDSNKLISGNPISPNTIDARRWGIIKVLKRDGIRYTEEQYEMISEYVRRLKLSEGDQLSSRRRGQAAPLRWPSVIQLIKSPRMNYTSSFQQLRDKALLCFMAVTGCRESEACGKYGVRLKDFHIEKNRIDYVRIVLKGGNRSYSFRGSIAREDTADVCPYKCLKAYIEFVIKLDGVTSDTKLFIRANSNGEPMRSRGDMRLMPMGANTIDNKLKDWALSAGLPREALDNISGHSLRIGLAVDQVELGQSYEYISHITGQTIATVQRYAQQALLDPFNVNNRNSI